MGGEEDREHDFLLVCTVSARGCCGSWSRPGQPPLDAGDVEVPSTGGEAGFYADMPG